MEHTFSSKQIVSKVTRNYESLLDCISKGLPCQVLPGERLQALWSLKGLHIFQVFLFAVKSSMEQIKSTGLVLSENNLVKIPIGFYVKLCQSMVAILNFQIR
jgi:hypothetical protein